MISFDLNEKVYVIFPSFPFYPHKTKADLKVMVIQLNNIAKVVIPKGKPRRYPTAEDFQNAVVSYLNWCNKDDVKQLPNTAGFCVYEDISRETYYKQKEYYSDTYKKVEDLFENAILNCKHVSDTRMIFLLKNRFGWKDRLENMIVTEEPIKFTMDLTVLTEDELRTMQELTRKAEKVK